LRDRVGFPGFPPIPGFVPLGFKESVGFLICGLLGAVTEDSGAGGSTAGGSGGNSREGAGGGASGGSTSAISSPNEGGAMGGNSSKVGA